MLWGHQGSRKRETDAQVLVGSSLFLLFFLLWVSSRMLSLLTKMAPGPPGSSYEAATVFA